MKFRSNSKVERMHRKDFSCFDRRIQHAEGQIFLFSKIFKEVIKS